MNNLSYTKTQALNIIGIEQSEVIGQAIISIKGENDAYFFLTNSDNKVMVFNDETKANSHVKKIKLTSEYIIESFTDYEFDAETIKIYNN